MSVVRNVKRRIWPQVKFKVDPNSTHEDFLIASINFLISKTPANSEIIMVEVGTGGASSRVLRTYLEHNVMTRLISFENDPVWLEKYKVNFLPHARHSLVYVKDDKWDSAITSAIKENSNGAKILSFIDSSPWESRIQALNALRAESEILLIHDVDYFPHNTFFGRETMPIKYAPANAFFYGKLKPKNLGLRNYDDVSKYWVEAFPRIPGYFTGPPTLIASEKLDVREIEFPKGSIKQGQSGN